MNVQTKKSRSPKGHIRPRHIKKSAPLAQPPREAGEVHPRRYPMHKDPAKGQVYGGVCNTTACHARRAVWLNRGTFGLYCTTCAHGQNRFNEVPICIGVKSKPSIEEMDAHHAAMMQEMRDHKLRQNDVSPSA